MGPASVWNLVGQKFGLLKVTGLIHVPLKKPGRWVYKAHCRCDCGGKKLVLTASLKRGATTSCGCRRDWHSKFTGENSPSFRGYRGIRSRFWNGYQRGAEKRGIPFDLTMEYAWSVFELQGGKCAVSGVPLAFGTNRSQKATTASLDRIDSALGYTEGNVQWVHKTVNLMKNTLSSKELVDWCKRIVDHDSLRKGRRRGVPKGTGDHSTRMQ